MKKVYLGIFLVFLAGIALGVVGSRCMGFKGFGRGHGPDGGPPPPPTKEMILERFSHDLDLTADQKEKISGPLFEMHEKMEALRADHAPKVTAAIDEMLAKVKPLLNAQQVQDLEKITTHFRRPPGGPGFGGPGFGRQEFDGPGSGGPRGPHGGPDHDRSDRHGDESPPPPPF